MALAWCSELGMTLAPGWGKQIEDGMTAEAVSWGFTPDVAHRLVNETVTRQSRLTKIDLTTVAEKEAKTVAGLRKLRSHFVENGESCLAAARDPLFSRIVRVPPDFDLQAAATKAADNFLEDGGYASWQTPTIQARGDLMTAAGTCRSHIGAARSDAIFKKYSHASDPRERAYYVRQFDSGLVDTEFNFDAVQCERLIKRLTAKAEVNK